MTATSVASARLGDHTDPAVTGLQLRVRSAAGALTRTWFFRYKWRKQTVRILVGHLPQTSLADAREKVLELRRFIDDGIDPRKAKPRRTEPRNDADSTDIAAIGDPHSIETLCKTFMDRHVKPQRKRPEYAQRILDASALKHWKGRDARTITPVEVLEVLDAIVDNGSPVMANRTAALLGQMFKYGIHRRIVADSPVKLLYRPGGKEKSRERALTDAELKSLLTIDPKERWERFHHAINLLLLTGMRRSELALGSWKEID